MAKKPPNDKPVSPRDEREILDSFRESFQHDFPNPQRIGCPGGEVLRALAWRRKLDNPETVVTHIGKCSPCFQEHRVFLQQYKSRQRLYRLAAVAVLILGVGLWVSWRLMRGRGTLVPEPPPIVKTPSQPAPPVPSPVPPSAQEQRQAEVQVRVRPSQARCYPWREQQSGRRPRPPQRSAETFNLSANRKWRRGLRSSNLGPAEPSADCSEGKIPNAGPSERSDGRG